MDTSRENIADRGEANGGGGREPRRLGNNKLCYTVPKVAELLSLSRNFAYELVKQGKLPVVKFGKRLLIPRAALEKMLGKSVE